MTEPNAMTEDDALETLSVADWDAALSDADQGRAVRALEEGRVLFFPFLTFPLHEQERRFLTPAVLAPGSKNVSFDPDDRTCRGTALRGAEKDQLGAMIERFGIAAEALARKLAPGYAKGLIRARTSFRPAEVEGRASSVRKNDRLLHVDAFPTRPTGGKRILRLFSNVAPDGAERRWEIGEPFPAFAQSFLARVHAGRPGVAWLLARLHLTQGRRSAYDALMLELHDTMKEDAHYQMTAPRVRVQFRPGTSWMVYTDQVLHAALAGQYALEQTFHLPVASMVRPECAPLTVLERLAGRPLV